METSCECSLALLPAPYPYSEAKNLIPGTCWHRHSRIRDHTNSRP